MKKLLVSICLLFSIIVANVYADESKFWTLNSDNTFLRSRIDKLNNEYFNGKLNVTYIDYKDNLLSETNSFVKSYFWNSPYKQIIVVDSQYFNDKFLLFLDSYLLDQLCVVYVDQFYPDEALKVNNVRDMQVYKDQKQRIKQMELSSGTNLTSSQQKQNVQTTTKSSSPTTNSTETIDKSSWWKSREEDSYLRKRFEELNKKYFNGELKVKYIRYGHGLIDDNFTAITYYWNSTANAEYAYQSVITVDDKFFVTYPGELDGALLHEMCHVYANMHDADAEISGIDGHQLPSYKKMMKHLIEIGANPRTGEGIVNIE